MPNHITYPPNALAAAPAERAKPFVIELLRKDLTPGGYFTPDAQLVLTSALRTSGLLFSLSADDLKDLVLLLTFLSPGGHVLPSVPELAEAMHVSEAKTRHRMERLTGTQWQGQPLVVAIQRESGLDGYALSGHLYTVREAPPAALPSGAASVPLGPAAGREAVYAYSRSHYSTPRAEAERMILEQLGHTPEEGEDTPEGTARRRLAALGVARDVVERLMSQYPIEEIQRQLEWLPLRQAKFPARLIVAAIEKGYAPPLSLRQEPQQPRAEEELQEQATPSPAPEPSESPVADPGMPARNDSTEATAIPEITETGEVSLSIPAASEEPEEAPDEAEPAPGNEKGGEDSREQ